MGDAPRAQLSLPIARARDGGFRRREGGERKRALFCYDKNNINSPNRPNRPKGQEKGVVMPPGGVHLMSGLGFIRASSKAFHASETLRNAVGAALYRLCPQVDDRDRWKAFSVGIVCGTILPDADLLLCIMIGAVGAISEEDLKVFHRTFSHSLVVVPALAAALVYWLRCLEGERRAYRSSSLLRASWS